METSNEILSDRPTDGWTELDQLFDDLRGRFYGPLGFVPEAGSGHRYFQSARADVRDTGASYTVTADVPGIPKDRLAIRVRGASVEIRGEVAAQSEKTDGEFLHRERSYQGYYRALELPEPVIGGEAKARLENGVLELELPKQHPTPSPAEVQVPVQ
ncbi:MAG: Hsp20/alpha crystallin family protein [Thermoplasmata archaeon]|nr:Hsp20/alpha crystallin family protein [Thermoplasmata archaeon]